MSYTARSWGDGLFRRVGHKTPRSSGRLHDFLGARERTGKQEQFPRRGGKNTELTFTASMISRRIHTLASVRARSLFQKSMIGELLKAKERLSSRITRMSVILPPGYLLGRAAGGGSEVVEVDSLL